MKTINRTIAEFLIHETNGEFFTASFVKKDGSARTMNCRLGVKKHLQGGQLKFSPASKGLLVVYDIVSKGYRMINLNTLSQLKINGKVYNVSK